jgi:hypothetical protein
MTPPRAPKSEPIEVIKPEDAEKPGVIEGAIQQMMSAERRIPLNPDDPHSQCVPREEYDAFVKDIRNQISRFEERVNDLETVVAQPQGAVTFFEPEGPARQDPVGDVPWYGATPLGG